MEQDKFGLFLIDPPWHYNSRKTGGERNDKTKFGGGAEKHYPLIKDRNMRRLAKFLPNIAADNAIMFLWATMPRLDFAIECMELAGFEYKTNGFTYLKTTNDGLRFRYGPGFYTASNAELCLVGVRGKGLKPVRKMVDSVICTPRPQHSTKPPLHDILDDMYPYLNKIELFARRVQKDGWTFWGNQVLGRTTSPIAVSGDHYPEEDEDEEEGY